MKKKAYKDKLELIDAVKREYDNYPPDTLNCMWLMHMMVLNEILKSNGHNDYKLPHLKKNALAKQDRLPTTIENDDRTCIFSLNHTLAEHNNRHSCSNLNIHVTPVALLNTLMHFIIVKSHGQSNTIMLSLRSFK